MMPRLCLFITVLSMVFGQTALAVGVGVKPKNIDLPALVGRETKTELLIMNVDDQPAVYQLYPDALNDWIIIKPAELKLEANANQIVEVSVKVTTPGLFSTNISVVARSLSVNGFSAASGVKIPIVIRASGILWQWLVAGLSLVCLSVIFGVKLKKKHKNLDNNP